ncbi:MAG: hypothetical protein KatS3mg127_1276 [Silanimonas sp.]|nr:MAG: hypothetical protein KatS3mg127_1276 [Silanimonas sp.]
MPIKLVTGTPGAGKTLTALQDALSQVGVDFSGSGDPLHAWDKGEVPTRPVFFCNVRGLDRRLPSIETPWDWESCPDGSLIVVDEAWEFFGKHLRNADDPRILNLAKHRHRGFDFIFTTQAPSQLSPFVRDLIGSHVHVTRKFGTETTIRYEWPHVQESPNGQVAKAQAIEQVWTYPRKVFALYESATLHTVKRRIPAKVIMALVVGVLSLVAIPAGAWMLWATFDVTDASPSSSGPSSPLPASAQPSEARSAASTERAGQGRAEPQSVEDYIFERTPRVPTDPASAPLYDRFEVQDYPRMFCVISGDQRVERISCRCRTQQMTPVLVDDRVCITIARHGYWDPRLPPVGRAPVQADLSPPPPEPQAEAFSRRPVGLGAGHDRSIRLHYVPPGA